MRISFVFGIRKIKKYSKQFDAIRPKGQHCGAFGQNNKKVKISLHLRFNAAILTILRYICKIINLPSIPKILKVLIGRLRQMEKVNFAQIVPKDILRRQNICGGIFIILYAANICYRLAVTMGGTTTYAFWQICSLGVLAICGFFLLYRLSSNMSSDIFSAGLLGFEVFFSFVLPYLNNTPMEPDAQEVLYVMCVIFSIMAIYLWLVMLGNNRFRPWERPFINLLPATYLINMMIYCAFIGRMHGNSLWLNFIIGHPALMNIIEYAIMVISPIGYWLLCHSAAFSGNKSEARFPNFLPIKPAAVIYVLAIATILVLK